MSSHSSYIEVSEFNRYYFNAHDFLHDNDVMRCNKMYTHPRSQAVVRVLCVIVIIFLFIFLYRQAITNSFRTWWSSGPQRVLDTLEYDKFSGLLTALGGRPIIGNPKVAVTNKYCKVSCVCFIKVSVYACSQILW